MAVANTGAVPGALDSELLHKNPAVTGVFERPHELVENIGMIRQRHLRRRKSSDAAQRIEAENGGEMMLPGGNVEAEVLHRSRGRNRVTPGCAKPFDRGPIVGIQRQFLEIVKHVIQAHCPEAMQEAAGIVQHHARPFAFLNELRDELAHAFVAPVEDRCIVVIADVLVVHHVLQIADQICRPQVAAAGWNQRLMHVQRNGECAADAAKIDSGFGQVAGNGMGPRFGNDFFRTADVGQSINVFGQSRISHRFSFPPE